MSQSPFPLSLLPLLYACLAGSPPVPSAPDTDAGIDAPAPAPPSPSVALFDHAGATRSWEGAPRQPVFVFADVGPLTSGEDLFLLPVSVGDDPERARDDLYDDLAAAPARVAHRERALPLLPGPLPASWIPAAPLLPATPYVLGLAAWAPRADAPERVGEALALSLHVAETDSGATLLDTWPPRGASGVPTTIAAIHLRFDAEVMAPPGSLLLRSEDGRVFADLAELVECTAVGWAHREGARCLRLVPREPLPPHTRIQVTGHGVRDLTGATVAVALELRTGGASFDPFELLAQECALDEEARGPSCVRADDDSLSLRARVNAPVAATLEARVEFGDGRASEHRLVRALAPRGEVSLALVGLGPAAALEATLTLRGLDRDVFAESLLLGTHAALPTLTITEVRADPLGQEPRQEYVELHNRGRVPVPLLGFALSDRADALGDVVEDDLDLPGGARALLVADDFDPLGSDGDASVPEGVLLVRLGSSLASGGLRNAGEPLFLRDAAGVRLSTFGARPSSREGECWHRRDHSRHGEQLVAGPCTPGRE